jgi:hypothetical protein
MTQSKPKAKRSEAPTPAKARTKAPRTCRSCARWKEVKRQMGIVGVLEKAVVKFEKKLDDVGFQPTVSEFLKLVQIEQEYEREMNPPEEIRVTWVEPTSESET